MSVRNLGVVANLHVLLIDFPVHSFSFSLCILCVHDIFIHSFLVFRIFLFFLGLTVWELWCACTLLPFSSQASSLLSDLLANPSSSPSSSHSLIQQLSSGSFRNIFCCPDTVWYFILQCLSLDPLLRPSVQSLHFIVSQPEWNPERLLQDVEKCITSSASASLPFLTPLASSSWSSFCLSSQASSSCSSEEELQHLPCGLLPLLIKVSEEPFHLWPISTLLVSLNLPSLRPSGFDFPFVYQSHSWCSLTVMFSSFFLFFLLFLGSFCFLSG